MLLFDLKMQRINFVRLSQLESKIEATRLEINDYRRISGNYVDFLGTGEMCEALKMSNISIPDKYKRFHGGTYFYEEQTLEVSLYHDNGQLFVLCRPSYYPITEYLIEGPARVVSPTLVGTNFNVGSNYAGFVEIKFKKDVVQKLKGISGVRVELDSIDEYHQQFASRHQEKI